MAVRVLREIIGGGVVWIIALLQRAILLGRRAAIQNVVF
jgi:hypothetical protein